MKRAENDRRTFFGYILEPNALASGLRNSGREDGRLGPLGQKLDVNGKVTATS